MNWRVSDQSTVELSISRDGNPTKISRWNTKIDEESLVMTNFLTSILNILDSLLVVVYSFSWIFISNILTEKWGKVGFAPLPRKKIYDSPN